FELYSKAFIENGDNVKSIRIIARACFFMVTNSPLNLIIIFIHGFKLYYYSSCVPYRLNRGQVKKSSLKLK
ncbi:TPA: hypothetical protein ACOZH1_002082, partial [Streptococcus pneumoniae]